MSQSGFQPKALSLDIETSKQDALKVWKLAAWRADTDASVVSGTPPEFAVLRLQLDRLSAGARFILGHNLRRHDLPVLKTLCPDLALHELKLVDTLELSPLAFPANPYHRLVKDYKLLAEARNDPLQDAKQAFALWTDQLAALQKQFEDVPDLLAAYHYLAGDDGLDDFFTLIRRSFKPDFVAFRQLLPPLVAGKICPNALALLLPQIESEANTRRAFAYVLAWLMVSGGDSVLPPWVRAQYPQVREQITLLRETPCTAPDCPYCSEHLNVRRELERYFGFDAFRPLPAAPDGGSLQEAIVRAGYAKQPLLAILPTGGGKSVCYQLPALSSYWRSGALTIIVSPLQSLMKDQVDNLVKAGILCAATLNGMLTMPERKEVLERIRLGGIGILLVSPEQFRNTAFTSAIRQREIAAWVFDEAHCLSRWGNDFRTDYLYVSRYIREHYPLPLAPVYAFTATAKADVIADLLGHFRDALGMELQVMDGGVERHNLHYEVIRVEQDNKRQEMLALLRHELADGGGAVIFVSSRKHAEEHAEFLRAQSWACSAYHAGFDPGVKKAIQQDFIGGDLRVIVATNAFGMGVDKQDIRLVIHADIPGSLENYLQEAGRAGRDRHAARCVLLYCREDIETQFGLALRSRLTRQDIAGVLRLLKRHAARQGANEMVLTSGEILRLAPEDEEAGVGIVANEPGTDTRVRTALHWLESAGLVQRNENRTQVFPASLKVASLAAAEEKLVRADLPPPTLERYRQVLAYLMSLDDDAGVSTDEMTQHLGLPLEPCLAALRGLEQLQLLSNEISISCWLRKGVAGASHERLQQLMHRELALISILREQAPDAEGEWSQLSLRLLCEALRSEYQVNLRPDEVIQILHSLARPLPRSSAEAGHEYLQLKVRNKEQLHVHLLKSWSTLQTLAQRRQSIAQILLAALEMKLPDGARGASLYVASSLGALADAVAGDIEAASSLGQSPERVLAAVNAGLLFMHDHEVIILDKGKALFRSAMSLKLLPESKGRGFRDNDFMPLRAHYDERTLQIHVMHEYARLGLGKMADALAYILAYFSMPKMEFIRRYFSSRQDEISRAATHESWQQIVGELGDPDQAQLVTAKEDENLLVLAGPGSGKTRVIVHRVAFLVRIKGVSTAAILVLAYNRAAAGEIRQRLRALLGQA
ncbi:RecQ family ATP-dependent DNA helicase, partial [Aquitalea sp. S1-19]|nr:RecQ family ATP-dependent DNA helicase [Aquitalea sp. S1-19]